MRYWLSVCAFPLHFLNREDNLCIQVREFQQSDQLVQPRERTEKEGKFDFQMYNSADNIKFKLFSLA